MVTRTWLGGTGDWYDSTQWDTGAPIVGDGALVLAGTVSFLGSEAEVSGTFDAQAVTIGSQDPGAPAQITSVGANFGSFFSIQTASEYYSAANAYAAFLSVGTTGYAGSLNIDALNGGVFVLATQAADGTAGGDFVLETNGTVEVSYGETLDLSGRMDDEGDFSVGTGATFINTGTLNVESSRNAFIDSGTIAGGGTVVIGLGGFVSILLASADQTYAFSGPGGTLQIDSPRYFTSTIQNFGTGDQIDIGGIVVSSASYNATTDTLTAFRTTNGQTSTLFTLNVTGPTNSGTLTVVSDGAGGTVIVEPGSLGFHYYAIAGGDIAMGSNTVRATMTTASHAPISGTGIKIGIISDSFNNLNGANTDAASGFLPANPDGTSAVTILKDDAAGNGEDEGRAMAELVHQVAPGAQIYFYTDTTGDTGMAAGINQMVADGVNVIVDDVKSPDEPFFQVAGPLDTSIQNAINSGVSYFTSATNYGNAYYQAGGGAAAPVNLVATTLQNVSGTVYAQTFSDGTNYQAITLTSTTGIDLEWDAPYPTTAAGTTPLALQFVLYDTNGNIVATSRQSTSANGSPFASAPEIFASGIAAGSYEIGIYQTAAQHTATPVSVFKYIMFGSGNPGGYIADPAAMNGSGATSGHDLVPGVNTVAASSFANSPAITGDKLTEFFSANGPGTLLFDSSGNRLATPVSDSKPNFVAPDGIDASRDMTNFQPFYGTSAAAPDAAALAALMLQANPNLELPGGPAQVTSILEQTSLSLGLPASQQGSGLVQAVPAVTMALSLACYATGTHLLTAQGEVRVERLRVGDSMVTEGGARRPVVWIGRRSVECRHLPNPAEAWPIRVQRHAFGPNLPHRDLLLSPDHAVLEAESGLLIPIRCFVNATSIAPHPVARVTYWHVELDSHDVLLAEGLPAESYLDTGNRAIFANALPAVRPPVRADGAAPAPWRPFGSPRPASRISVPGVC